MNNSCVKESTWLKIHLRLDKRVSMCWSTDGIHKGQDTFCICMEKGFPFWLLRITFTLVLLILADSQRTTDLDSCTTCCHPSSHESYELYISTCMNLQGYTQQRNSWEDIRCSLQSKTFIPVKETRKWVIKDPTIVCDWLKFKEN